MNEVRIPIGVRALEFVLQIARIDLGMLWQSFQLLRLEVGPVEIAGLIYEPRSAL
jgi:hypothetical protein